MINAEDDIVIDTARNSSTKDEAVAKMIGWMRSPVRKRITKLDSELVNGRLCVSFDDLPHMHTLEGSLMEMLLDQRKRASLEFQYLFEREHTPEECAEKEQAADQWIPIIEKASIYLAKFDKEIAKNGDACAFQLDQATTTESGVSHYWNESIDTWAQKTFGISIFGAPHFSSETPPILPLPLANQNIVLGATEIAPSDGSSQEVHRPKMRRFDSLAVEVDSILNEMRNPTPAKVMADLRSRIGSQNTCVTANLGDGVQWESDTGKVKKLSISALTERISTWKKHRINQG
jgi:hypothetical protein